MAHKAVQTIKNLYLIEKEAREKGFNFDEVKALRQSKAKTILENFKKQLETWQRRLPPKSLSGKAVKYTLNEWSALEKYIDEGRIQIDNNLMENAIRPIAVGRKNWLFNDTPEGCVKSCL